jgi:hypothetical protein
MKKLLYILLFVSFSCPAQRWIPCYSYAVGDLTFEQPTVVVDLDTTMIISLPTFDISKIKHHAFIVDSREVWKGSEIYQLTLSAGYRKKATLIVKEYHVFFFSGSYSVTYERLVE